MIAFYALLIVLAVFADAVLSDQLTLVVRVGVLVLLGAVAFISPHARRFTGFLTVVLLVAVAAASGFYAIFSPPDGEASGPATAEFDIEACRIKSTTSIGEGRAVTVVFVIPGPVESGGQPPSTTFAVNGTAVTRVGARATTCMKGSGGPMVRIRVERGEAGATVNDFVRGIETASAIHLLPRANP